MYSYLIHTDKEGLYDITDRVQKAVTKNGVRKGIAVVCGLDTTAGITINENSELAVNDDLLGTLGKIIPDHPEDRHFEGGSAAHLKANLIGKSVAVPIENGKLVLGKWQGIHFCEFDGPRGRTYYVQVLPG